VRRVLVTGASRGIGRAVAVAFAEGGDRVAVHCAANRVDAEETLRRLPGSGHACSWVTSAIPRWPAASSSTPSRRWVGSTCWSTNAAVAPSAANRHAVAEVSYPDWQRTWHRMLEVNLLGAANMTYCVARHLIDRGAPGSVVNIGSRGAFRGEPEFPAYGASKAALHAFGQSMAIALAPHRIKRDLGGARRHRDRAAGRRDGRTGRRGDPGPEPVRAGRDARGGGRRRALPGLTEAVWSSGTVLDLNGASHLRT